MRSPIKNSLVSVVKISSKLFKNTYAFKKKEFILEVMFYVD